MFYPESAVLGLDPNDDKARARLVELRDRSEQLPGREGEFVDDLVRALLEQGSVWPEGQAVAYGGAWPEMTSAAVRVTAALAGLPLVPPDS